MTMDAVLSRFILRVAITFCFLTNVCGSYFEIVPNNAVIVGRNVQISCFAQGKETPISIQIYKMRSSTKNDAILEVVNGTRTFSSELLSRATDVNIGLNHIRIFLKTKCKDEGIYGCLIKWATSKQAHQQSLYLTARTEHPTISVGADELFVPGNAVLFKCTGSVTSPNSNKELVTWTVNRRGTSRTKTENVMSRIDKERGPNCGYGFDSIMWYDVSHSDLHTSIFCDAQGRSSERYDIILLEGGSTTENPGTTENQTPRIITIIKNNPGIPILVIGCCILVLGITILLFSVIKLPKVRKYLSRYLRKPRRLRKNDSQEVTQRASSHVYVTPDEMTPHTFRAPPAPPHQYESVKNGDQLYESVS